MDLKDLGILGGAGSAAIAAISYWAKTQHERRRATRIALFYLLEAHHLARRLNVATNHLVAEFVKELKTAHEKGGSSITEAEATSATEQIEPLMRDMLRSMLEELSTDIRDPYAKALTELAREDPILAFKLRGRDQLLLISQNIDAFIAQASAHAVAIEHAEPAKPGQRLNAFLIDTMVTELDHAVRLTASRCDLLTRVQVLLLLRRTARREVGELREFVTDMVKKVLPTEVLIQPQPRSAPRPVAPG
jgi:hypothetical protein